MFVCVFVCPGESERHIHHHHTHNHRKHRPLVGHKKPFMAGVAMRIQTREPPSPPVHFWKGKTIVTIYHARRFGGYRVASRRRMFMDWYGPGVIIKSYIGAEKSPRELIFININSKTISLKIKCLLNCKIILMLWEQNVINRK